MKTCSKCKISKQTSDFYKCSSAKSGLMSGCKECMKKVKKASWATGDSLVRWKSRIKKEYGIDSSQYDDLYSAQNGRCAICERHQSILKKRLHIDHDHETGDVRGLLCHHCNTSLGGFGDSVAMLSLAIKYLENHKEV